MNFCLILYDILGIRRNFGTAQTKDIKHVLDVKNISYTAHSSNFFDSSIACDCILAGMPVLAIAHSRDSSNNDGHCWLIDGVKVYKTYDTYYNQWMPMGTFPPVEPEEPDWNHLENYVISDPVCVGTDYYFRMNWGWDGNYDNTLYYYDSSWSVAGYSFQYQRNMIYNFN